VGTGGVGEGRLWLSGGWGRKGGGGARGGAGVGGEMQTRRSGWRRLRKFWTQEAEAGWRSACPCRLSRFKTGPAAGCVFCPAAMERIDAGRQCHAPGRW
jgi:hypothetical protein